MLGRPPRSLPLQLGVATLGRLLLNTARRFPYPYAPVLARGLGVPLPAVTSLIALSQATGLLSPLFGPLGDRWGYRTQMLGGLTLLAGGMFLAGGFPAYGPVLAGVFLAGLGKSAFDPAIQAWIGHRVPVHRRGLAIGLAELAWSGSALLGVPAVGLLIELGGWRAPFLGLGVLAVAAGATLAAVVPRTPPGAAREEWGLWRLWRAVARDRASVAALGFGFFVSAANDALFVVYGAWLESSFGLGVVALGAATTAIGLAEFGGEGLTALLADRLGLRRSALLGAAAVALAYALLPLASGSLGGALLGLAAVFLACEFTIVSSFSLVTELLPGAR
ncbi:MAG: MFS transporter, partial [Deferrisomatales bacterium]